nr:uncharacterized protein LOC117219074 [Megalopta genalis]
MLQLLLISVAGLLIGNAVADVLVQPGYGQPQMPLLPQQIVPPLSALPHVPIPGYGPFRYHNPGYHLELHPVYGHLDQSLVGLGHHQGHDLSGALHRRLHHAGLSGFGIPRTHAPLIPLPAHRRFRRSASGRASGQREKRVAVATKSTLNGDNGMVVDLLNSDEKENRVEVRQSKNDQAMSDSTLLGLNPLSMYPAQNQYQFAMPSSSSYQQIVNQEPTLASQINTRAATHEPAITPQNQAATTMASTLREIKPEYVSNALPSSMVVLNHSPWRTAQYDVQNQQRNYPDPRPMTDAERIDYEKSKNHIVSQQAKSSEPSGNDEIVGSHHHKTKTIHLHQHGSFRSNNNYENEASTPCTCQDPVVTVYYGNDEATNNLQLTQLGVQQPGLALQLASLPGNDSPNREYYTVAPQTYRSPLVYSDYRYSAMPPLIVQEANTFPLARCQLI